MNKEIVIELPYINQSIKFEPVQRVQYQGDQVLCPMCQEWHSNNTFCQANF